MMFKSPVGFQKRMLKGTVVLWMLVFFVPCHGAIGSGEFGNVYAIKAGKIITVTGGILENGTILVRDGIIQAVGPNVVIPPDAEVVTADTMWVYPGLIDAHTSLALKLPKQKEGDDAQEQQKQTPASSEGKASPELLKSDRCAADLLNPKDSKIAKVRQAGVTTVLTVPTSGIFIGQSALINLFGDTAEEMILKSPVAMHLGYQRQSGVYPSTLFGVIAYQRQTFLDAQHHHMLWDRYKKQKAGWRRPLPDKSLDALIPVLEGNLPIIISANKENEMKRAVRLAEEFGLNYLISGATEGWRIVDLLKAQQKPILVSLNFPKPKDVTGYAFKLKVKGPEREKPDEKKAEAEKKKEDKEKKEEDPEKKEIYANAGVLHRAGITFAFTSQGLKKPDELLKNAAKAVEHGLPKEEALKAMTINPATIFGVADQVGSIEEGKIANLVITTGSLFDEKTKVKLVFIDGHKIDVEEAKKKPDEEPAVDVTGTWEMTVTTEMGDISATVTLVQTGSEVTGTFRSEMGTSDITDGTISGSDIEFSVTLPIMDRPRELVFIGTVEEDTMEGSLDLGAMGTAEWKATRPGWE
jgi:imidazolonepropionase-like amidohydrolase